MLPAVSAREWSEDAGGEMVRYCVQISGKMFRRVADPGSASGGTGGAK